MVIHDGRCGGNKSHHGRHEKVEMPGLPTPRESKPMLVSRAKGAKEFSIVFAIFAGELTHA